MNSLKHTATTAGVLNRFGLDGQLALVTGASSGLGRHFAKLLASAGARVAVAARRSDKLQDLVDEIEAAGGEARAFSLDVSDSASVKSCFDRVEAWGRLDLLINNAGNSVTKPLLEQSEQDWDTVMNTNLKGHWLVATEAARRMVKASSASESGAPVTNNQNESESTQTAPNQAAMRRGGCIVNIASILGERVSSSVAPYAISKAGVVQATKVMALELARYQIRVNALLPGYVITDLNRQFLEGESGEKMLKRIPLRRFCTMDDLDGPLLLLASDAGAAMTGATLVVDAGHLVNSL